MIHPDATKRIDIVDYDLEASGRIAIPTSAVALPQHPLEGCGPTRLLDHGAALLGDRYETLFVVFADGNARPIAGGHFTSGVVALPDGEPLCGPRNRRETRLAKRE